jgi:multiple sugar transport system substrate-binding protein
MQRVRAVHFGLAALIVAVFLVGWFEHRPALEDVDAVGYDQLKDVWNTSTHIAYWEKWSSFEAEACQSMVDEFNQTVGRQEKIIVHYVRKSQVDRSAMLAILGHNPPDVVGLWAYNVVDFAGNGALEPLDERMKAAGLGTDHYIKGFLDLCQFRKQTWVLPSAVASLALFWNKEHFRNKAAELREALKKVRKAEGDPTPVDDNAEVPPPRTIAELDAYADILNEFNPDGTAKVMAFLPTEPGWWNYVWGYHFGGELIDPVTGNVVVNDKGNVDAYTWLKKFAEKYGREKLIRFKSGFGNNFDSPFNAFINGQVSMELQGVWFPNFIRRHKPQMEFGVAPFPCATLEMGPRGMFDVDVLGIPVGCKHPEEAWKFILWVQRKGTLTLNRLQGKSIPWREIPPSFLEGHPNKELGEFIKLDKSPKAISIPTSLVGREVRDEMNLAFEHIWNWPVENEKAAELEGLEGEARQKKIEELCRQEVQDWLDKAHDRLQKQLDNKLAREKQREGGR